MDLINQIQQPDPSLLRQTVVEVAALPDEDLVILLEVVAFLKRERQAAAITDIRQAARQYAAAVRAMPREQLARQFHETGERIRTQVIESGTAINGDWEGD
jgi:hypothetical protein